MGEYAPDDQRMVHKHAGPQDTMSDWHSREQEQAEQAQDGSAQPGYGNARNESGQMEQLQAMTGNRELREIFRWELGTRNAVTDEIARRREKQGSAVTKVFERAVGDPSVDVRAVVTLLSAGINYLALRAQTADVYNGIPLTGRRGWTRIEGAIDLLLDLLADRAFHDRD